MDQHAVTELKLYVENTRAYYDRFECVRKRKASGDYNHDKALAFAVRLMRDAAKDYAREYADPGYERVGFPVEVRKMAAAELIEAFEAGALWL